MSIRWIKNVLINDEKTTIEVQLGDRIIGDKCYTRISNELEIYFNSLSQNRGEVLSEGLAILKKRLKNKKVLYPDGREFDWKS